MNPTFEPIAIVGVAGQFPGARDLNGFWKNILERRDASREIPGVRWPRPPADLLDERIATPDRLYSTRACLLDEIPFDPNDFPLPAEWFEHLDPVFQLTLSVGARAWADSRREAVDPKRVGVTLANIVLPTDTASAVTRELFGEMIRQRMGGATEKSSSRPVWSHPLNRFAIGAPAGLLARTLGLGGGTLTLDAACASSLYSIKLACDALHSRRADAMIAGGVSRPESMYTQMGFCQLRALSPTGTPRPLDARADGIVVGEGAGIFVLKRLNDALLQGDKIYGVIRGVGLANDRGGSLLAPDSDGQLRAMLPVYEKAGWKPWDVDLIECHATGTPVGDATELRSLLRLWSEGETGRDVCGLGSVKSNVGHLLTAAGAASLTKVLLGFAHETLPPTANYESPPEGIELGSSPFRVQGEAQPWSPRREGEPLRAAVSAFGFGGINGHLLVEDFQEDSVAAGKLIAISDATTSKESPDSPKVAIVGMEVQIGSHQGLREFQEAVFGTHGRLEERPKSRWWGLEDDPGLGLRFERHGAARGAFMEAVETPLGRFRIPPRELEEMLPQQLLILTVVDAALRSAGGELAHPERTGVFIGIALDMNTTNFFARWCLPADVDSWKSSHGESPWLDESALQSLLDEAGPALTANRVLGALGGMVASRVAREIRAGGPSYTISAEENSGLRALEIGVRALQKKELDAAVVGAVDLGGDLRSVVASQALRPAAGEEGVAPLGEGSSGSALGEGAVCLVLRRLEDAERDGQRVFGVIEGLGFASGGDGTSLASSAEAYGEAIRAAREEAGPNADRVGLLEVWGSGFSEEDGIESRALSECFRSEGGARTCALSGLQARLGNTGAVAGLASVSRAALALYQEILPSGEGMFEPRAVLLDEALPFHTLRTAQYWFHDRAEGPRIAAASCMSLDGNVGHVILSEGPKALELEVADGGAVTGERSQPIGEPDESLVVVEGESRRDLIDGLGDLAKRLESVEGEGVGSLFAFARNWWLERRQASPPALGLALVARDHAELSEQIGLAFQYLESGESRRLEESVPAKDRIFFNPHPEHVRGEIAFVFPGSGNQYVSMGMELGARWPHLLRRLHQEHEYLGRQFAPSRFAPYRMDWSEGWEEQAHAELIEDHRSLIFGHVSHSAFLSDIAQACGVRPSAVIGYSLGETAGYFAMRAWNDRDEMMRRVQGTPLFTEDLVGPMKSARSFWGIGDDEPLEWRVGVVDKAAGEVRDVLKDVPRAYLLIVNTPLECVIGGEAEAVSEVVRRLGCSFFPLQGISTVHCEVAKPVRDAYRGLHLFKTTAPPDVRFYSGAFGCSFDLGRQSAADSIVGQAITGFEFPRLVESAYGDGVRIFLEMGPQASCSRMIGRILGDRPHVARSICLQGQSGYSGVLRFLARLVSERVPVDLSSIYGEEGGSSASQPATSRLRVVPGAPLHAPPEIIYEPEPEPEPEPETPATEPLPFGEAWAAAGSAPDASNLSSCTIDPPEPDFIPARPEVFAEPAGSGAMAPQGVSEELVASIAAAREASAAAHEVFLRVSQASVESQSRAIELQMSLIQQLGPSEEGAISTDPSSVVLSSPPMGQGDVISPPEATPRTFDRERCLEFARGKIANVLGVDFVEVDKHPTRVRLPDEPLMLVDRITATEGEPGSLGAGRLVTEHDVLQDGWYLDGGRMAPGVTIEAGQADLFLCAFLGIDFETKGIGKYRLLDAAVTYHRSLPEPGEVIRYDIRIERFARQGSIHLFFFNYDGFIGDEKLMTMRQGCAGFFSDRQLDEGRGLVLSEIEKQPQPGVAPIDWQTPVELRNESYDSSGLEALRRGDLAGCFGEAFGRVSVRQPYTLPSGDLALLDRVTEILPGGGRYGLGMIRAEKDIDPEAWFLTCHFVDDPVMPGTLMYESSLQALRVLLLRMGWVGETGAFHYEPRPGVNSRLRCRGQVKPGTRTAAYEVSIREFGFGPEPYAIADTIMYADGRPIVLVSDISIQMTGLTRSDIDRAWGRSKGPEGPQPAVVDRDRILSYTNGSLVHAFGERYRAFDEGRFIARLPQEPFLFLDRVTRIDSPAWELVKDGVIETEFDVPSDAWFFQANRQPSLPFSVLLEYPLQSCGWFSAYMGSALQNDGDLFYRNLGGKATLYEDLGRDSGTLHTRIRTLNLSRSAGMLIQSFEMTVTRQGRVVYEGDTSFGFFSRKALSQQVGVRGAQPYEPTAEELARSVSTDLEGGDPANPEAAASMPDAGRGMPATAYRMIDRVEVFVMDGGPQGLGFIRGTKPVNPKDWFFQAHFFQDPVWPGSLGLEAFLQLQKFMAYRLWGDRIGDDYHFEPIAVGQKHEWIYRGQVIPTNREVTVDVVITERDDTDLFLKGNGFLKVDGLVIYEMKDFAVRAVRD